jgi:hypothetical protein
VLGETEVMVGICPVIAASQSSAWQIMGEIKKKAAEISNKSVVAWRSGLTIALPKLPKGFRMGCGPFVGWLRASG